MEQNKQERNYEFNKEERMAIINCYDNPDTQVINVDHVSRVISIVDTKTNEIIKILGGVNVPTTIKLLKLLEVKVTCEKRGK